MKRNNVAFSTATGLVMQSLLLRKLIIGLDDTLNSMFDEASPSAPGHRSFLRKKKEQRLLIEERDRIGRKLKRFEITVQ